MTGEVLMSTQEPRLYLADLVYAELMNERMS
jgi:hypothetical protein